MGAGCSHKYGIDLVTVHELKDFANSTAEILSCAHP
jgi:hypothetical protein